MLRLRKEPAWKETESCTYTNLLIKRHGKLLMCDARMRRARIRLLRHDVQVDPLQDVLLSHNRTKLRVTDLGEAFGGSDGPRPRASQDTQQLRQKQEMFERASASLGRSPVSKECL